VGRPTAARGSQRLTGTPGPRWGLPPIGTRGPTKGGC
jgi:hypothetical protein